MLTRLLAAAGVARASSLERERRRAAEVRSAERARANREIGVANNRVTQLTDRLRATQERLAAEQAESGALRQAVAALRGTEAAMARRPEALRRLKLAQLAIAAKGARRGGVTRAAARRAARLAAGSADYADAVARWRSGDLLFEVGRVVIARLHWSVPAGTADERSRRLFLNAELPLDDLAAVREFVAGGVMLDVGAHVGAASIPRVLLGDCARVHAAEPESAAYLCLVGNTLDNGCEGRVLPQRLAIAGSAGPGTVRRAGGGVEEVPFVTVDAWMTRLRMRPRTIRFVRVALQDWNMDLDRGAVLLLKHRHVVWQIEIPSDVMQASGPKVRRTCERLAAHFTHVQPLGGVLHEPRPASEAVEIAGAGGGFLLFNMHGDAR
ncbi:MAG: hypothetical protein A3F70_15415 [Acidobacteria bacterium RIFCSPLOWO2_12_FULL_67_14]|nr:MAG: hypothetical protein A3F70_15415 [Acidobacteria bacterium RIFCSPLOWO2_12_FULL_67_14]